MALKKFAQPPQLKEARVHIKALYESVTATIIKDLEAGVAPWVKPWKDGRTSGIMPHNGATHRPYNGINVVLLWAERELKGYKTPNWMTYRQALSLGAQVRGGEKATTVVFTKKLQVKDKETEEDKTVPMLRTYAVFNEDQIDGLDHLREPTKEIPPEQSQGNLEAFITATGASVRSGGNKACYVPSMDFVSLPEKHQFESLPHYYATALHELGHWTGHKTRLDRDLKSRFHLKAYAAEELIAELTAAFLCAHLGIEGKLRHADYIASWIELLKEDPRAIFTASSQASKASDFLRAFSEPVAEAA